MNDDPRVSLLRLLSDPVRLRIVDTLGHAGPQTPSELVARMGVPAPQLSNHLKRLREGGLVDVERRGRVAIYSLADQGLQVLLPVLDRITGQVTSRTPEPDDEEGRTCYDHLAGRLGVELYRALLAGDALAAKPDGTVDLGPRRDPLERLGVDLTPDPRRRFAFECLDARQHAPHLAGVLGDALADALERRRWIERGEGRAVMITPAGRRGLRRLGAAV
jgi:DNA-binding transcriptional ArsR family regulator